MRWLPRRRRPGVVAPVLAAAGRSLTAAVSTVRLDGAAWQSYRFGDRAWQADAWRLYDITGQLRFVGNWVGNSVSRCRLYVAELDDSGEPAGEASDPDVAALAAGPLGTGAAKDEALRLAAINLFVAGECYIIAEHGERGEPDRWFVVSGRQIRRSGDRITVRRPQLYGGGYMPYRDDADLILRCWTPHPADYDEPDSPTRSAIPDLREIEALRKREFAELDSRLTGAGLLLLPEDMDFPRGNDDPPGVEGFASYLLRVMSTSLQDRSSAAAMVPILATAPAAVIDKVRHITFWSELSDSLLPMREAALRSLAQSLDTPPEVMLGLGSTNHWSAWAISEEAITTQIVPVLSRLADALTRGYLRDALDIIGADPDRYGYAFDTAPLATRPNRTADALNYHEAGLISDDAALTAGAWGDDTRPDDNERLRRLAQRLVLGAPTLLADPAIRRLLGITDTVTVTAPADPSPSPSPAGPAPVAQPRAIPTPPTQTEPPPAQTAALNAVAGLAVRRALTLAGSRLVPHRERDRYAGTARHDLHTRHGPVPTDRATALLDGAFDDVAAAAADLGVDPAALVRLCHGYTVELLTRGMPHDPTLLRECVDRAGVAGCRT